MLFSRVRTHPTGCRSWSAEPLPLGWQELVKIGLTGLQMGRGQLVIQSVLLPEPEGFSPENSQRGLPAVREE